MEKKHKDALKHKRVFIMENLDINEKFLAYFLQGNILLESHLEEIMSEKTKQQRISCFLSIFPRRGPRAMAAMMDALQRTGQTHVADALDPLLAKQVSLGIPVTEPPTNVQETGGYFPPPPPPGDEPNLDDGGSPFIDVKVRPFDPNHFRHLVSNKDVYKIQRKKRSRALIINNENFMKNADVKLKDREGSNFDMINLDNLLNQLGYTTEVKTDLSATEMLSALHAEQNHPDHADADSFVLAIFSHGATGAIYGRDGKPVQIEDIKESFDGLHCKSLAGKPKLFIIQACQGSQSTKGVPVADAESSEEDESGDPDRELAQALRRLKLGDRAAAAGTDTQDAVPWATVEQSMAHEKGDMLVAYSTVQGYKSWRLPEEGSWFIRTLVKIFMHYANQEHVVDLLTRVRDAIARKQTGLKNDGSGLFVQMTRNDDTLRKKWYFFPGYPATPTF